MHVARELLEKAGTRSYDGMRAYATVAIGHILYAFVEEWVGLTRVETRPPEAVATAMVNCEKCGGVFRCELDRALDGEKLCPGCRA
jgi:formylmethanofuran dehydrogenase subunit E